jgi:hypothetical protein
MKGAAVRIKNVFVLGGVAAAVILIIFGTFAIVLGIQGRDEVRSSLSREAIVGTPDMTPKGIAVAVKEAGLTGKFALPTCSVANETVNTGNRAKCFADYMRIHALEATGGLTYSQTPRFIGKNGKPTNDQKLAAIDTETKQPIANDVRNTWITEVALSNALNTSFFAENVALFGIVTGIALLLTGIGFLVLTLGALREPKNGVKA